MPSSSKSSTVLAWLLLLSASAIAQPVTVLDRIGGSTASTDDNPGGLITHYSHGSSTRELWGTCGTVWTQPFSGTLNDVAFVGFSRVVASYTARALVNRGDLGGFSLSLHLWTNGAAVFLNASNSAHGDIVIPLGDGPSVSGFGTTRQVNTVANSPIPMTNTMTTFYYGANVASSGVHLEAGRQYVMAFVCEGSGTLVVRQSLARGAGAPDVLASYAAMHGLTRGYVTDNAAGSQFATRITAVPATDPFIAQLPVATTRSIGGAASLSVTAGGTGPLSYQWRREGTDLPGATNATLSLTALNPADAGWYSVVVTNASGSVTCAPVALTAVALSLDAAHQAELTLHGAVAATYQVDFANWLGRLTPWQAWANFTLTNSPHTLMDTSASNAPTRFYRVWPGW